MTHLYYTNPPDPSGAAKAFNFNWALLLLVFAIAGVGFIMLFSVAGGNMSPWADAQLKRFAVGVPMMIVVALIPIWFWRSMSFLAYLGCLALLLAVDMFGTVGMGAQRWIDLGFIRLQPSELTKIAIVMVLAAYYDWLPDHRTSRPLWVLIPVAIILLPMYMVLKQPDLGTSLLLGVGGVTMMFLAGVSWLYFLALGVLGGGTIFAVFALRGTEWQPLQDYQYRRIDVFLDPSLDPLGAGYNITQSKIALGSGGWTGRGFMQGTQSQLNFLPEKQTDFIFTTLAEEFGFVGAISLLGLYGLVILFCIVSGIRNRDRYGSLLTLGLAMSFFLYFAVNISMVMGLAPVVGLPLPLVSYGGSAMLVLLLAFGLIQSAHIHRTKAPR